MGIFDKSNYIVNTGIIEQFFQCTAKVILLAKMIKLWTLWECGSQLVKYNMSHRMFRHRQEDVRVYVQHLRWYAVLARAPN